MRIIVYNNEVVFKADGLSNESCEQGLQACIIAFFDVRVWWQRFMV